MVGVVDVHRAAQSSAVVGRATTPVEADVIYQEHGDGAEVDLSERGCVELETVPKHQGMTGCRATKRSRGGATRTVSLDKNRAVLDK